MELETNNIIVGAGLISLDVLIWEGNRIPVSFYVGGTCGNVMMKIATVTAEGKVKGIKAGTATITCTSNATGKKATCTVTVLQSMVSLPFNGDELMEDQEMDNPGVEEPFDVYDLNGRMVKSQVISLDGLPRGIYIINGKKVMKQ